MKYADASYDMKVMKERFNANISKEERKAAYTFLAEQYNDFVLAAFGAMAYKQTADRLLAHLPPGPARVLDVGCGTGVLASYVHDMHATRASDLDVVGCDYTPAMLAQARKTGLYTTLHEVDINDAFALGDECAFDAIACAGVFVEGHNVLPCALVNVFAHLRPGGVACVSIRKDDLSELGAEYEACFVKGGCEIVSWEVAMYRRAVPEIPQAEMFGLFVVAKKRA